MTSSTQTSVGKGKPNPLIAEGLLHILRDLILPSSPKPLTNFLPWSGRITKARIHFPNKVNYKSSLSR